MTKEYPSKAMIQLYASLGLAELQSLTGWTWVTESDGTYKEGHPWRHWFALTKHEYDHYGKEFLDSLPVKFFIYR